MASLFEPVGVSGLRHSGGIIQEEWDKALRGTKGRRLYREMLDSDYTVGAVMFALKNLLIQMDWPVVPYAEPATEFVSPESEANATFVEECLHDMSSDWMMTLSQIATFLGFGFAPMETVFKRRLGRENVDAPSNHNDGRIGWRKWSLRAQDSVDHWELDDTGGVQGLWQLNEYGQNPPMIPIDRMLLFRTTEEKSNPEGRSILRNAYEAWRFKREIARIEAIGIERDLAGLPVMYVPAEWMGANATDDQKAIVEECRKIVTNIRVDDSGGIVAPSMFDEHGNKVFELQLLSTGGARSFDTNAIIGRYDTAIATTVLADFIRLGHESVGSFALADSKTSVFGYALGTFADMICAVINQHAIPRLLALNGMRTDQLPRLTHGDAESADLEKLANYVDKLAGKGVLTPGPSLEAHMRELAGLPPMDEEEMASLEEEEPEEDASKYDSALAALLGNPAMPGQEPDGEPEGEGNEDGA